MVTWCFVGGKPQRIFLKQHRAMTISSTDSVLYLCVVSIDKVFWFFGWMEGVGVAGLFVDLLRTERVIVYLARDLHTFKIIQVLVMYFPRSKISVLLQMGYCYFLLLLFFFYWPLLQLQQYFKCKWNNVNICCDVMTNVNGVQILDGNLACSLLCTRAEGINEAISSEQPLLKYQ